MSVTIRMCNDRHLVQRLDGPEKIGLIIVPKNAEPIDDSWEGIVISSGPGKMIDRGPRAGERCEMSAKPGDRVLVGKYQGTKTKIMQERDDRYIVIDENIMAVVEPAEESSQTQ